MRSQRRSAGPIRHLLFAGLTCLAGLLPFAFKTIYFMEPDDYLLNYIANGSFGFDQSEYLIFLQIPHGYLLKGLYAITTNVNWYGVLLIAIILLGCFALYEVLWDLTENVFSIVLLALIELVLLTNFLTFTMAGFFGLAGGFALILRWLVLGGRRWIAVLGVFLAYLGFGARTSTLPACGAVFAPLLLFGLMTFWKRKEEGTTAQKIRRLLLPILLAILVLAADHVIDTVKFSQGIWPEYRSYNNARSSAVDFNRLDYEAHRAKFEEIGISPVDYEMIHGWRFAEKSVFSEERMRAVGGIEAGAVTNAMRLNYLKDSLSRRNLYLLGFPYVMLILLVIARKGYRWKFGLLVCLFSSVMSAYLLLMRMRFVARVNVPLFIVTILALLLLVPKESKRRHVAVSLVFLALFCFLGIKYVRSYQSVFPYQRQPYGADIYGDLLREIDSNPDTLYVIDGPLLSTVYYFNHPVMTVKTTEAFSHVARSGSWDSFSPRYYNEVSRFSATPDDLIHSLMTEEDVRFVSVDASVTKWFLAEHYGFEGEPQVQEFDSCPYKIYSFYTG